MAQVSPRLDGIRASSASLPQPRRGRSKLAVLTQVLGLASGAALLLAVISTWDAAILVAILGIVATLVVGVVSLVHSKAHGLKGRALTVSGMAAVLGVFLVGILLLLPAL